MPCNTAGKQNSGDADAKGNRYASYQSKCLCRSCKPGDIRDRGLYSTLPIPYCANSVLYPDYTEMPKFGGYDFALVVTCGLTRFTRVFPCTKHITGEETIKILVEE